MTTDLNQQRAIAARLANALAPMIEAQLLAAPNPAIKYIDRKVPVRADKGVIEAALRVVKATDHVDQSKFAGGREVAAREALLRACRSLRTQMKHREAHRGSE